MLIDITKVAIYHHALCTEILCSSAHQPAPTRRIHAFGLRDEDNTVFLDPIGEVLVCLGSCSVAGVDHLHSVGRSEDLGLAGLLERREHLDAVEIATVWDFEFYESITDL
jgi:hypothetical protein